MKKRKMKKNVSKIFLILLFILFIIFLIWFIDNKKNNGANKNNDDNKSPIVDPKPSKPDNPSENEKPEVLTYLNNITYDVNLDKDIEKVIIEYMDLYYKSMKELKEYDFTYLFANEEAGLINQTAISLLVEIRKLKPNDLTLDKALYDLKIESVSKKNDTIEVKLRESNYLNFNFMKDITSRVYNVENDFTFKLVDGKYKIVKYNKVQDFYVMVTGKYSTGGAIALNKIKSDYLNLIKTKEDKLKVDLENYLNNKGINLKICDHSYDRLKAKNYAVSWVGKRNSDWPKYDSNCQNYVSQVVYEGTVPMDYIGENKWGNYNNKTKTGSLDTTWTYVPYFYNYVKNNTGYGICGDVDVNLYYAEAGDVIHVGTTGPTKHALIVIDTIKENDKVIDVLVNSNTVDLENYPISAYVYPYVSLIKIYGWND